MNKPASFWLRLLAFFNDYLIVVTLNMLFLFYAASQPTLSALFSTLILYLIVLVANPLMLFQSAIFTYYFGGSLGKLLTGLRVTNEEYKPLSVKRIFFRQTLGYQFSAMIFGLGYFSVLTDPKRQAWHDKTIGSLVVIKKPLWVVGLLCMMGMLLLNGYLISTGIQTVMNGPLRDEAIQLFAQYQTEAMRKKMTPEMLYQPEESSAYPTIYPFTPDSPTY